MPTLTPEEKRLAIRKSTELLRQGATMLGLQCPQCGSPLFKLRSGEVVCPLHGRVIIARTESDVTEASLDASLDRLEKALQKHLETLTLRLETSQLPDEETYRSLKELLELITLTRGIRNQGKKEQRE